MTKIETPKYYSENDGWVDVHTHIECPFCKEWNGTDLYGSIDDEIDLFGFCEFSCQNCKKMFHINNKFEWSI